MSPPKAKLHSKTGRLKNINKTYTSTTNSSNSMNRTSTSRTMSQVSETNQNETATTTQTSTEASTSNNLRDTPATEQFELELCWCIQTLEKSIESGKLNEKQGERKMNSSTESRITFFDEIVYSKINFG